MECLGGSGYIEDSVMPRLYRQAPLNGIWEGSGNVICLDLLRTMNREPQAVEALLAEAQTARGGDRRLDRAIDRLEAGIGDLSREIHARRLAELIAVVLQAGLLVKHGPAPVADAFCASRLDSEWHGTYGTLPGDVDFDGILKLGRLDAAAAC
jgi:putative acyl-CoA dehydrogenase